MLRLNASTICASLCLIGLFAACGGGESDTESFVVEWTFEAGDCASNGVERVRVTVSSDGGAPTTAEFACADGGGDLGVLGAGSYSVQVEGLSADGSVVAENFGTTTTFGEHGPLAPLDVTIHPKSADVTVSWSVGGLASCPTGVVLPFFVSLYVAPAEAGGELGASVAEVQESCASGQAILTGIAPGAYVAEVDSRAIIPAVRGTAPVVVEPGKPASVSIDL